MKPLSECRLYTFVDTAYLQGRLVSEVARQLCDGGSDIIQLRAKSSAPNEIQRMVEDVAHITESAGVHFVVNDHVEIAQTMAHPFCHLGQEDFFDAGLIHTSQLCRKPWINAGSPVLAHSLPLRVGLSTHSPCQAKRAIEAGADYIAIGPVFATPTKPTVQPVTLQFVRWAADNVSLPWFAIGGITLERLDEVLAAGARRVCIISAILGRHDVYETCQRFHKRITSVRLDTSGLEKH